MSTLTRWIIAIGLMAFGIALQVLVDTTFPGPSGVLWRALSYFVILNALVYIIAFRLFGRRPPKNDHEE
jgi:hypothetical protein